VFLVPYRPFIKDLVLLLDKYEKRLKTAPIDGHDKSLLAFEGREEEGEGDMAADSGQLSWLLKEYVLIDELISQLEEMSPAQRRRALMTLQVKVKAMNLFLF
jgi:hypothetical protein